MSVKKIFALTFIVLLSFISTGFSGCETAERKTRSISDVDTENFAQQSAKNSDNPLTDAITAYYKGNIDKSITLFKDIFQKGNRNQKAFFSLVRMFEEKGDFTEADILFSNHIEFTDIFAQNAKAPKNIWETKLFMRFLEHNYAEFLKEFEPIEQKAGNKFGSFSQEKQDILADVFFLAGWVFFDLKEYGKSEDALKKAITLRVYFPEAYLMSGKLYYEKKEYNAAERYFNEALKFDSNFTQARPLLARSLILQNKFQEGYAALKKAIATRPWDKESKAFLVELEKNHPEVRKRVVEADGKKQVSTAPPETISVTPNPQVMPNVRVGLADNIYEIILKTGGSFTITDKKGAILLSGAKNRILKIISKKNIINIYNEKNKLLEKTDKELSLENKAATDTTLLFNISHSIGYQSAGQEDRAYRGKITFLPVRGRGITIINTLPMEEYLYSVVPSEMPAKWPAEALAAQAIAARSYTFANMGKYSKKGYDVSGSILSAFYRGYTGEAVVSTQAVESTRGLVLKADGKYLSAYYSANSAGRTESVKSVWGMSAPIVGVTDPQLKFETEPSAPEELTRWILSEPYTYSSDPKYYFRSSYRWKLIVSPEEIEARIGKDIGKILAITPKGRGDSGRIEKVIVKGSKKEEIIERDQIRSRLGGLRSNLFIVVPKLGENGEPDYFIFAGAGWGHGAGMCQTGAAGLAATGASAKKILKHYYPLAELVQEY